MKQSKLIRSAQEGNMSAFYQLIQTYGPVVEKFSYQIGNKYDEIDDIVQEVFIRMYRFLQTIDRDNFTTWLYKVTLNVTRDMKRKDKRNGEKIKKVQNEPINEVIQIEDILLRDERARELHKAVQHLDEKYKLPLVLHYFQELSYQEITNVLGLPMSTVKTRIMRAKQQLKELLLKQKEGVHYVGK